ncbi:hypothetical protein M3Y97_00580200 [Aphelenchoides bicaudatus]|nr:hypothetical protein M3Y97_00580200 [Aphelenchoides bicaudatus]
MSRQLPAALFLLYLMVTDVNSLVCHQCNGVHGWYPDHNFVSTCNNLNNACATTNFCVKVVDPIVKSKHYTSFKSDCFYSTAVSSQTNSSSIQNNRCYPFNDGGSPPKQYLYCFCNDRDFCNHATAATLGNLVLLIASAFYLCSK